MHQLVIYSKKVELNYEMLTSSRLRCFLYSSAFLWSGGCEWILLGWLNRWCSLKLLVWQLIGMEAVLQRFRGAGTLLSVWCWGPFLVTCPDVCSVLFKACSTFRHVFLGATEPSETHVEDEEPTEGAGDEVWTSSFGEPWSVNWDTWWEWQGLIVLTVSNPESSDSDFILYIGRKSLDTESLSVRLYPSIPAPVSLCKSRLPSVTQFSKRFPKFL